MPQLVESETTQAAQKLTIEGGGGAVGATDQSAGSQLGALIVKVRTVTFSIFMGFFLLNLPCTHREIRG
eukprot:SAG31_NODE_2379_length_5836_cov_4.527453_3_plen_69_part_00